MRTYGLLNVSTPKISWTEVLKLANYTKRVDKDNTVLKAGSLPNLLR